MTNEYILYATYANIFVKLFTTKHPFLKMYNIFQSLNSLIPCSRNKLCFYQLANWSLFFIPSFIINYYLIRMHGHVKLVFYFYNKQRQVMLIINPPGQVSAIVQHWYISLYNLHQDAYEHLLEWTLCKWLSFLEIGVTKCNV